MRPRFPAANHRIEVGFGGDPRLDVIEKAIRSALDKGNADDRAYRERVYRSAFAALDRALAGNANITPEVAEKRRGDLQAKVAEIETEFIPAVPARPEPSSEPAPPPPPPPPPPAPTPAPPAAPSPAPADAPEPDVPVVELDRPPAPPGMDTPRAPEPPSAVEDTRAPEVEPIAVSPEADVPSVDAPTSPSVVERAPGSGERIEPKLDASSHAGTSRLEPRFSSARAAAEARASGAAAASEPTLPGSQAPRPSQAERPVPEAFFPDVTDFDAEARLTAEPDISAEISAAGGPNVKTERRRPLAGLFIGVTLLALAGIGVWWGISTGLIKLPGASDSSVIEEVPAEGDDFSPGDETPLPGSEGAPQKPSDIDAERAWIPIFTPADPSTLSAPSDAKAELVSEDTGDFVRVRSGASGSAVAFDISRGVLEQVAGKHVRFAIVARAEEGKETQFSVDCNFAELGDCGRKRFTADYEKRDFFFEIDLPAKAPGAEGTLAITSDVDQSDKALDIYEIKVSISE